MKLIITIIALLIGGSVLCKESSEDNLTFAANAAWIAVKNRSPEEVVSALGLSEVRTVNWATGIKTSVYPDPPARKSGQPRNSLNQGFQFPVNDTVFVFAASDQWSIAVGQKIAFINSFMFKQVLGNRHPEHLESFVRRLSRNMRTTVQYFGSFPVPETHMWVWADSGDVVRAYGFAGERIEVLFNVGKLTPAEVQLQSRFAPKTGMVATEQYPDIPDTEYVLKLAKLWSVNPEPIGESKNPPKGLVGRQIE